MAFRKNTLTVEQAAPAKTNHETVNPSFHSDDPPPVITSFSGVVFRMVWCFIGPALLSMWALRIAFARDGWVSPADIGFLLVLTGTVASRWICFRSGDRNNTMGEVTTTRKLHRYTNLWLIGGTVVWIVANVIGNQLLR